MLNTNNLCFQLELDHGSLVNWLKHTLRKAELNNTPQVHYIWANTYLFHEHPLNKRWITRIQLLGFGERGQTQNSLLRVDGVRPNNLQNANYNKNNRWEREDKKSDEGAAGFLVSTGSWRAGFVSSCASLKGGFRPLWRSSWLSSPSEYFFSMLFFGPGVFAQDKCRIFPVTCRGIFVDLPHAVGFCHY